MMAKHGCGLRSLIKILCIFSLVQTGYCDDWFAEFLFPATTGYVMHNMDVMEVSYKSNYPNASLWAFCYNGKVDNANLVIMGVYKNAKPLDGSQLFQFTNDFSSDFCWYNLRNLDNDEKGLNGIRFSYDWKTRATASTLKAGSKPEITNAPGGTTDAPASTSATATSKDASSAMPTASSSDAHSEPSQGSSSAPATAGPAPSEPTQTSGGASSGAPKQGERPTTNFPAGQPTTAPLNATAPLTGNGTVGGSKGTDGHAAPPLGGGVVAGIVVGAVLGVLGIFGFLGALWLVKRRRRTAFSRHSRMRQGEPKAAFEVFGRAEIDGKSQPQELSGDQKPGLVELPG